MYCDWIKYGLKTTDSGIYMIKNINNGKMYIGSAKNLIQRLSNHLNSLKNNKHHSLRLQNSWNKGNGYFVFGVIEFVPDLSKLISVEQKYIDFYKSYDNEHGYNICPIARSSLGCKRMRGNEERSIKSKGNGNPFFNKKHTLEALKKISENQRWRRLSNDDVSNIKELWNNIELKQKDIAKLYGVDQTHISKIVNNKSRTKTYN